MKRSQMLLVLSFTFVTSSALLSAEKEKAAKKEKAKHQLIGTWKADFEGQTLQLTFKKKGFTALTPKGTTVKGSWTTDDKQSPKHLDVMIKSGDEDVNGKTALCIYEIDGDKLKWCANDPKRGNDRPTAFPEKQGGGPSHIYAILKRVKK